MAAVLPISTMADHHNQHVVTAAPVVDAWREATPKQREIALSRELFISPVIEKINAGVSQRNAINNLLAHIETQTVTKAFLKVAKGLARKGKDAPSRSAIAGWVKAYREDGKTALLDNYTGRVRQTQGWEVVAYQLYNLPSKPSFAAVARKLREEYKIEVTDSAVRRYLKSLPAELGTNSPERLGRKLYNNTQRHYIERTTENLPVGALYQGDGHTLDVYLAHPVTGDIWRAELTIWMDVRSRFIVAWYISNAESAIDTIRCLSMALTHHNHVPPMLYVDNGSGYASKMMDDEVVGFYNRLDMDCIFAIPGNAKAKGQVERWFRTMERDLNIWFGAAFCGEGSAKDVTTKFVNDCKNGKAQPPSLQEWSQRFVEWLDRYHNRPHPEDKTTTPAELWATLEATPVNMDALDLARPQKQRKVLRGAVNIDNRQYRHAELIQFNRKDVIVQYDLHSDEVVTIRTLKGELICDATLTHKKDYIPSSRIEESKQKSLKGAIARLDKKIDEKKKRAGLVLDHTHTIEQLEHVGEQDVQTTHEIEQQPASSLDIDLSANPETDTNEITINLLDEDI